MATVSHYAMRRYPVGPVDGSNQLGTNQYYVANSQRLSPMYDKSKKTWSQRLKISKTEKQLSSPLSELPDYSASALSRSMKYAEPWLYGTVRGIPARPVHGQALFAPLPAEVAVVVCSCPEYLNGTKKEVKKASICKKCKGSRLPLAPIGGTVRIRSTTAQVVHKPRGSAGTMRLPVSSSMKSRPTILDPQNDPYDLMRRSRLLSPEPKPVKIIEKAPKNRTKSTSPTRSSRSRTRNKSDDITKNGSNSNGNRNKQECWLETLDPDPGGRRSILHCDVNPYDLISGSKMHNNEFAPDNDDIFTNNHHHMSGTISRGSKKSDYSNVKAIAGQRISLGKSTVQQSLVNQNGESFVYEKAENLRNNDQIPKDNEKTSTPKEQPKRPPRRKQESSADEESEASSQYNSLNPPPSAGSENLQTAGPMVDQVTSHKSGIKSILKRPSSVTSSMSSSSDIDTKSNSETRSDIAFSTKSDTARSGDGSAAAPIKGGDKLSSQFYLPLPTQITRKKVQFMVEDEIIQDEEEITFDGSQTQMGAQNPTIKQNGEKSTINGMTPETRNLVLEAQQKQQQILQELLQLEQQQKHTAKNDLVSPVVVIVSGVNSPSVPVAEIQPNQVDNIISVRHADSDKGHNGLTTITSCTDMNPDPSQLRKTFSLRRTHSDRRSNTTTVILNFNDTMALRAKNNRVDSRDIIFEDVPKLSTTRPKSPPPQPPTNPLTSTSSVRETTKKITSTDEELNRKDDGKALDICGSAGNQWKRGQVRVPNDNNSELGERLSQNQQNDKPQPSRPPRQPGKRISWQDYSHHDEDNEGSIMIKNEPINPSLTENILNNDNQTNESVYESFSYQSETDVNAISSLQSSGLKQSTESVQFVGNPSVKHQNSLKHNNSNRKEKQLLQAQKEIYHGTRLFGNQNKSSSHNQPHSQQNQQQQQQQLQHHHHQQKQTHSQQQHQRTVVRVAPFNKTAREVHRLKIKHEDTTNGNCDNSLDQKKTSILINGDDCYSTVNVNNDTPLYQSSVVVTDGTTNTVASGNNLKVSSNTVTISVSNPHTPEEDLIYKNNKINTLLSLNSDNTGNTNNNQYGSSGASDSTARSVVPIGNNIPVALSKATTVTPTASGVVSPSAKKLTSNDVNSTKRKRTLITLDYDNKSEKEHNLSVVSHEEELVKILRNPVEAVKRNLVPHVCGKTDTNSGAEQHNASQNLQKIEVSIMAHKDQLAATGNDGGGAASIRYDRNSFIGKLLEDPTLNHLAEGLDGDVVAKLIENSLKRLKESRNTVDTTGTKDNDDMAKLIDMSLQKIKEERQKLEASKKLELTTSMTVVGDSIEKSSSDENQSNRGSISSGNSYGSANYELFEFENNESDCYQSCSSELTGEDDTVSTRSKFYQMLVDATLSEIEISTNNDDDHHYESIRLLNGDPIYEEISEVPPPLPLSPPPLNDNNMNGGSGDLDKKNTRSMFEGASKYDILSYLVDAKERGIVREETYEYNFSNTSDIIVEEEIDTLSDLNKKQTSNISSRLSHLSITSDSSEDTSLNSLITDKLGNLQHQRKTPASADIERNDSGVGSETSKTSRSKYQNGIQTGSIVNKNSPIHLCEDCDGPVETQITDHGVMYAPLVCRKCGKKRAERKEIITEIVETEEKYGRDLQIILEEFCQPMLVAGLLTQEQLSAIFLNTEELLENNQTLAERMRDTLDIAMEQGDDDLLTVNIGRIFLESTQMLHAFESYCVRQAAASLLLANLEKEKELLRIFLRVSQMENTVLRRMNLNSFLMVPVQRVTKYPLLLARLYKVTPAHLDGRELLKQAQEKIELHLNHMNQEAKDVPTKLWRRISSSSPNRRSSCEIDMINIKLRKMAIDVLEWNHDEVRFAMEGKLLFTQPTDSNWKKGRTIKLTPVNALLVTNGKPSANYKVEKALSDQLNFPKHTGIREASLLLVKEKCGRYTLIREPLYLDRCVVCTETDWDDYFEVQEILTKDTFIFKAEDGSRTKQWYAQIQYHAQGMGAWRKRRNALANIMINGMLSRT